MSTQTSITIALPTTLARLLPTDDFMRQQVIELGLKQWRVRQALEAYRQGQGTLAYAAEQAGVSLREMIPLAYAHGLEPKVIPGWLDEPLTIDEAARL
jgi:hypothetical protein